MSEIRIQARDGGCGSGHVSSIETMVDGTRYRPTSGTFIYPCRQTFSAYLDSTYISRFKAAGNTIFLNDSLYWGSPTDLAYHNTCQNNTCERVSGTGVNECSTPGQACSGSRKVDPTIIIIIIMIFALLYLFTKRK